MEHIEYQFVADGRTWTLDYNTLTYGEWMAAERATGMPWVVLAHQIDQRTATGILVFYWLTRHREEPNLSFTDKKIQQIGMHDLVFTVLSGKEGEQTPDPPPLVNGQRSLDSASSPSDH